MSYGYFQGQEAQALAYYKKFLETEMDPEARKIVRELVEKLEKIVSQNQQPVSPTDAPIQNACAA